MKMNVVEIQKIKFLTQLGKALGLGRLLSPSGACALWESDLQSWAVGRDLAGMKKAPVGA